MFLDPVEGFAAMQLAARALQERLAALIEAANSRADTADMDYYAERLRFTTHLCSHADPDDIFEQDSFRQLFAAELAELPPAATQNEK